MIKMVFITLNSQLTFGVLHHEFVNFSSIRLNIFNNIDNSGVLVPLPWLDGLAISLFLDLSPRHCSTDYYCARCFYHETSRIMGI
jgi:hypothetical protein